MIGFARVIRAARPAALGAWRAVLPPGLLPLAGMLPLAGVLLLAAAPAVADHPMANVRTEGLSPLALALVVGGLALAAALLVVVIVMLLTRKPAVAEQAGE